MKILVADDFYINQTQIWNQVWNLNIQWEQIDKSIVIDLLKGTHTDSVAAILWSENLFDFVTGQMALPLPSQFPQATMQALAFDAWVYDGASAGIRWWPRARWQKGISILCSQLHGRVNIHRKAFVVGGGPFAILGMIGLMEMGFSDISVVGVSPEIAQKTFEKLKAKFFSVQMHALKDNDLAHFSAEGSLILNTLSSATNKNLLDNLSFFNYLKEESFVINLCEDLANSELLIEAKEVGHKVADKTDFQAVLDYELLRLIQAPVFKNISFLEFRRHYKAT